MARAANHGLPHYGRAAVLMAIVAATVAQQGCLAAAWVAAVGADSMRTGDIRFEPFEASWVSDESTTAIVNRPSLNSLALMPVEGDDAMADRLSRLLLRETTLRVVPVPKRPSLLTAAAPDDERALVAREVTRELGVDAVLYGHVVCAAPSSSAWGRKTEESRRLFLYMVDRHGHLLWKDELPFLIVTAAKPALEESVQVSFTRHFMGHVHALGLDGAGYFPAKPS